MTIKPTAIGLAKFTLLRTGTFYVQAIGTNHCGTKDHLKILYRLEVQCNADSLDSRGFLFNQMEVDKWFQDQRITKLSCEQYTIFCGREIYKLIRRENKLCHIQVFSLTLSPEPHAAELTFTYGE